MYEDKEIAAIERAMVAIRRRQSRRALARQQGATGPEYEVLDVIEGAGGQVTVSAVAEALSVDQPRASRLVAAAVTAGLVRREADQADGRRAWLVLTEDGVAALAQARQARQAAFATATAGWSAAERAEFARLLTRFVQEMPG
ncbi:MarR family winged helix-turn-helix transcriptional regulator [Nonomuraea spiralis]|uniref:MarR family winged helix-turn-helix transcriptional regulator n=1 Tax=Nonomuraea spiralis TaxID=46182 RepID=A0ABV5IQ05_9ACTN|nr:MULTISPECIES: MarR family winged helix-turn-helix transcriptional regulator [Nonomuraea]RSN01825.1 MarR family transcriptional regulator [Nonomuraea sp. WAC 01424]GGT32879.1 MarR family transcriptional regulator [Nonomuraea spiralis]